MKEALQTIIESLVVETDKIQINEVQGEKSIVYEVKVADKDMGRIIGKEGRIAKAIRVICKSIGAKEHKKVTVEFID